MIREQSRFTINPIYIVGVALCCICSVATTLYSGLLFGLIVVVVSLLSINLVSFVEKIADKNLRAFLIAMLTTTIVVLCQYLFEYIGQELLVSNIENLKWVILAVVTLSVVPTYFDTRLSTKFYFIHMFYSCFVFLVLTVVYSALIEFLGHGTLAGFQLIPGFSGFSFALELFFQLFVIGIFTILANVLYQWHEDRKMRFELLVDRYKAQVKQVLINKEKQKEKYNG